MPKNTEKNKIITALCEKYALDILMEGSSAEEEEDEVNENFRLNMLCLLSNRRSVHLSLPKSTVWREKVLWNFDSSRFTQMVRVNPEEFAYILDLIKDDHVFKNDLNIAQFEIKLQLQIVLFRLGGEGLSIRKVASLFGIGDGGTIQNVTRRVFKAILKLKNKFLYWPNETERLQIVAATREELPGCVGYIDGSEIKLAETLAKRHELFYSRQRQYSIKMQAVCDDKLRIRQVTIGFPGSVHDAKMFSNCPLSKHPDRFFSNSEWIAGDSAYPLKQFLITPFRKNSTEHTRMAREQFNKYFSKYRVRIEDCFGILKERFCSLYEVKFRMLSEQNKKECNDWIMVCCILHNILISFSDDPSVEISQPMHSNALRSYNTRSSLISFINNK